MLEQVSDILRLAESISSGDPSLDPLRPACLFTLFIVIVCRRYRGENPQGLLGGYFAAHIRLGVVKTLFN